MYHYLYLYSVLHYVFRVSIIRVAPGEHRRTSRLFLHTVKNENTVKRLAPDNAQKTGTLLPRPFLRPPTPWTVGGG